MHFFIQKNENLVYIFIQLDDTGPHFWSNIFFIEIMLERTPKEKREKIKMKKEKVKDCWWRGWYDDSGSNFRCIRSKSVELHFSGGFAVSNQDYDILST